MRNTVWVGGSIGRRGIPMLGTGKRGLSTHVKQLFANNEQGFFYDPNDLSTMFQDSAGAIPVTGVGQPVGRVLDKSGRGNHATQSTSASRPILRKNALTGANYLEFDGTDDFLQTGNINFTATDKVSLFAGVNKLSTTTGMLYELSSNSPVSNGSFYMATPVTTGTLGLDGFSFRGTSSVNKTYLTTLTGPVLYTVQGAIGNKSLALRTNGVLRASTVADTGVGTLGNYPLFIGRRNGTSLLFSGHLYSLIGVGKLTTDSETAAIEKELAKRIGVTL